MRRVTRAKLEPAALAAAVSSPRHGAVSTFVGVVRAVHAGRRVKGIEYDCFFPLAEKELARIVAEAEKRWPARVEASHRIGALEVGEASVAVAAGSMHRPEAFAACRWTIDEIKRRLPVWKKEKYIRGEGRWLPGCALHGRRA
ncbi:MAG TPA: molybdenum cofactor biosynthesis protein MoaE [Elusimicrobiota bacterium]|jgi:molybdopterin synthase catalytic subunit|nr:molybdenum cofactor biosynthesis protein MoaE [Elusimicrobiota bacterium]